MSVKAIGFKKILYTTDLSDTSLHAFSYAVSLASCYAASITILHVLSEQTSLGAPGNCIADIYPE